MSHQFWEGTIRHKRTKPTVHDFSYRFFMVDLDAEQLDSIENNKLFAYDGFNLFAFNTRDHFGRTEDFTRNARMLLSQFDVTPTRHMRFITLPRILGFVFNPISVLLLLDDHDRPQHLLAEVHNYNGGRIVYSTALEAAGNGVYRGEARKDMHVSPFFEREGDYRFALIYDATTFALTVQLRQSDEKMLIATFNGRSLPFRTSVAAGLFMRHSLLTVWVVTRTLWQSLKLWRKGLRWHRASVADQVKRY